MRAKDIMTTNLVSVAMDDSLRKVKEIFDHCNFHHLLVVRGKKLVGIISDRDLLKNLNPKIDTAAATSKDLAVLNKKAHQIMHRKLIVAHPETTIFQLIDLFREHRVSSLPVVDSEEHPIGIISWRDILEAIAKRKASLEH